MFYTFLCLLLNLTLVTCTDSFRISPAIYPSARRDDTIVDNFFGTEVPDPYRWLENLDEPETHKFIDELNEVSRPFLAEAPSREQIRSRLTEISNYEKYEDFSKNGDYYYYDYNSGLQNQAVIYQQSSIEGEAEVFLNPNEYSADGSISIKGRRWTMDGSILAYGFSENGSDFMTIKFRTAEKKDLDDVINGVKFSLIAWLKDNSGIFYSKYFVYESTITRSSAKKYRYHSIYFHRMGTDYKEDILIYKADSPYFIVVGKVSEDGKFLIIEVYNSAISTKLLYYDLSNFDENIENISPTPLFNKMDAVYTYVDSDEDTMLVRTNRDAPSFKLIRISLNDGSIWDVVPENEHHRLGFAFPIANNRLLTIYLEDVKNVLYIHDLATGSRLQRLPLKPGTIKSFFGLKNQNEAFFNFQSFANPGAIYKISFDPMDSNSAAILEKIRYSHIDGVDEDDFVVEQVFYESKDATKIPMYIVSLKDTAKDGNRPTLLGGYGGFAIAVMPSFSIANLLFMKHFNGIIAYANIRGGGEYDQKWHKSGMRENKQNVFDDFIAGAEYLIRNGYTNNEKLAIHGGSNGGLLVAVCAQQRPDLYGAVIGRVGVLDMLRFHKFTGGVHWISEYGNPNVKEDFEFIYKYSPLHNIRFPDNGQWPSTLMTAADHDDRVVPSHTLKYAATLYEMAKKHPQQSNPLLFHIEQKVGHSAGIPTAKIIEQNVNEFSFLQRVLKLEWMD